MAWLPEPNGANLVLEQQGEQGLDPVQTTIQEDAENGYPCSASRGTRRHH